MTHPRPVSESRDQQRDASLTYPTLCVKGSRGASVGLVVDASNLLGGARERLSVPDYERIIEEVTGGRDWKGVACISRPADGRPLGGLLAMFAGVGLRPSVWNPVSVNGHAKTDADALVVIEAMTLLHDPHVSELCLGAGDSDYRYLARACRQLGKRFVVAAFRRTCHRVLHEFADEVIELDWRHTLRRRGSAEVL